MNEKKRRISIIVVFAVLLLIYFVYPKSLDLLLSPLIELPAWLGILIASLIISIVMVLVYKWMTDQVVMKNLKDEQKKFQQEMRKNMKDPKKVQQLQKKAMKSSKEYMMHSFKPTLVTFIPIIIIFAWLNTFYTFVPLAPNAEVTIDIFYKNINGNVELIGPADLEIASENPQQMSDKNTFIVKAGQEGIHELSLKFNEKDERFQLNVGGHLKLKEATTSFKDTQLQKVVINYEKLKPFGEDFNIFGWHPGWLGTYIIFSLIFSILLRKLLKVV